MKVQDDNSVEKIEQAATEAVQVEQPSEPEPELGAVDLLGNYEASVNELSKRISELKTRRQSLQADQEKRQARLSELERILEAKLPKRVVRVEMKRLVDLKLENAFHQSQLILLKDEFSQLAEENARIQADAARVQNDEKVKIQLEEKTAVEAAQKNLDEAKDAEERAIGQMKQLRAKEREFAERLVELTSTRKKLSRDKITADEKNIEKMSNAEIGFSTKISAYKAGFTSRERMDVVDPVFRDLVDERRRIRLTVDSHKKDFEVRQAEFDVAQAHFITLREDRTQRFSDENKSLSELETQQKKLLDMEIDIADKERELITAEYKSGIEHLSRIEKYRDFLRTEIDKSAPIISGVASSRYLDVTSKDNWIDAFYGVEEGLERVVFRTIGRFVQVDAVWGSFFNLLWWLAKLLGLILLVAVGLRFFMRFVPRITTWITRKLFTQNFFATRPRLAIKLTEVLRVVIRPIVWYTAFFFLFDFVAQTLPEVVILVWVIDAVFLYLILIRIVEVFVYPRWYRKKMGSASVDEEEDNDIADRSADLMGKEINRSKKLVWSAKIVITFWIVAIYVPNFIELVIGFSVISYTAKIIVWSFFLFLFFLVVSRWKNELANIFHDIATEREAAGADFVVENKDKWYGVFVIGLASFYVAFFEIKRWISTYVIETEIFTKVNNFLFRKKIEMQTKAKEAGEEEAREDGEHLPPMFCELFVNEPLDLPSELYVENKERTDAIFKLFSTWTEKKRQGSIAIIGEQGMGKTTLLRRVKLHLLDNDLVIRFETIEEKRRKRGEVLDYIRDLFEIERSRKTQTFDGLVSAVHEQPSRIIILDDCHHFFMRQIGGFDGLELLLNFVNLTDEKHFYILAFNKFTWAYVNRVSPRNHYFGSVVEFPPWSLNELQEIIELRCAETAYLPSFSELILTHEGTDSTDYFVEVVKTSNGYFRYLQEFSGGNLSVAMCYWLRSLHNENNELRVSLFSRPKLWTAMADDNWFVLTAIAQHGTLSATEVSQVANLEVGFCALAINYFVEKQICVFCDEHERAMLTPLFFRQVLKHLDNSNYLYA